MGGLRTLGTSNVLLGLATVSRKSPALQWFYSAAPCGTFSSRANRSFADGPTRLATGAGKPSHLFLFGPRAAPTHPDLLVSRRARACTDLWTFSSGLTQLTLTSSPPANRSFAPPLATGAPADLRTFSSGRVQPTFPSRLPTPARAHRPPDLLFVVSIAYSPPKGKTGGSKSAEAQHDELAPSPDDLAGLPTRVLRELTAS